MFIEVIRSKSNLMSFLWKGMFSFHFFVFLQVFFASVIYSQQVQTQFFSPGTSTSYVKSNIFRQEIARFEINVVRNGKTQLPITQVPRVQQGDVLKIRLLDEAVNGIKLDQSQWDWTFLVTYINPNRRITETGDGKTNKSSTVSEEIQFRKRGWYREYSFTVPYDSQPVFFLYPRPKYRKQLMKVVSNKYEELRKLGEKTIEIAGAYAQIGLFLNEMQMVLNRNALLYGYNNNGTGTNNPYNPYGTSNPYGSVSTYNPYNPFISTTPTTSGNTTNNQNVPFFGLQTVPMMNQIVEGLARSFNIGLPSCWSSNNPYASTQNSYGNYVNNNTSGYNSTGYLGYSNYGTNMYGMDPTADFVNRAQCVAKSVNLGDFDMSVMKMWQQGGVFMAAELQKKYPQMAYWINIAATAIDFIIRVFQKSPLKIVPSIVQSIDYQPGNSYQSSYSTSYSSTSSGNSLGQQLPPSVKISLFAESQPSEGQYVTAYPIVVHKWQAEPDPEIISLYPPVLAEPCLHSGINILKNTDLSEAWSEDTYSRDFKLIISSQNGFRKEFPLKKNIGLGGWELNITPEDMNQIPKVKMTLESQLIGSRGFNEIKSPTFDLPIPVGGSWEISPESQKNFSVGGKRKITLTNSAGSCRCLQRVIYKPSFGGQFVFEAGGNQNTPNGLQFSVDGREVSFEIDTVSFQPGNGTLELKTYGNDNQSQLGQSQQQNANNLNLKLYPLPPNITNIKIARNDNQAIIFGNGLEQIQYVNINGKRATVVEDKRNDSATITTPKPAANTATPSQAESQNKSNIQASPWGTLPSSQPDAATALANLSAPLSANERLVVFDDKNVRQTNPKVTLELGLEDDRIYQYPQTFSAGLSKPAISSSESREVEGLLIQSNATNLKTINEKNGIGSLPAEWLNLPIFSTTTNEIRINAQNILTDYDFKVENISIETRFEKSQNGVGNGIELPTTSFEILDWKNLRINFKLSEALQKLLGGRRLQFKIRDRERGDSDWYTIKQTFVRFPGIESVVCTSQMKGMCELKGEGIDYISQVSTDGGQSWYPQSPNTFQTQQTTDGKSMVHIPLLTGKKMLQIKLRDFPNTNGLTVPEFLFQNLIKNSPLKKSSPL